MRLPFRTLFEINLNGSIAPKQEVHFDGHILKPGNPLKFGLELAKLNMSSYLGKDLEVKQEGQAMVIVGFYA